MAKGQREVEERNDTGLLSLMRRVLRIYGKKSGERQYSIKIISLRVKGKPDPLCLRASHRQVGKSVIRGEKKAKAKKYSLTGK
jgi:hypothetical protein